MDCGPACLRMIAKYYGKNYSLQTLREYSFLSREGVSLMGLSDAAESIRLRTVGLRITLEQLKKDVPLPCILYWNQNHFVVCYGIKKQRGRCLFQIADPASSLLVYSEAEIKRYWLSAESDSRELGIVLALEPGARFFEKDDEPEVGQGHKLMFFIKYLTSYKKQLLQLVLGMLIVALLQLIFPFLTQTLVDVGIRDGNLNFITLILISQVVLSTSLLSVEFIRSWILLHVNARISISLISDFLIKLMKLPLHFFDVKFVGDIMQRIRDHGRIRSFLMGSSISTAFSFVTFFIFAGVLAYYNLTILVIFLIGNSLYVAWILFFMKYRRELDFKRFEQAADEESNLVQMVTAMQEIKLNNCETQKRWQWERIQVKLFKISVKGLALGQVQQVGSVFFNQTTNIIISFIAAKAVVDGQMTLGMMMSLTYIIGQLSAPVSSFIGFAQQFQDAKISLERLNEVHGKPDEEQIDVERLRHAVAVANIRDFIDSLPLGYNTKIGMEGNGISQGQKQRLLIARAVYKNPEFLFFDEATNALDANNEKEIMEHLHEFYKGKTVVVVAHRLSTVKDADKIVVLDRGCIAEEGTHRELTERKGMYYRLVKNQLELGS